MPIYYRQPYAGEYVFTAFSGSHQDAISKGMHKLDEAPKTFGVGWKVPYLHIDPADSAGSSSGSSASTRQSGKGGDGLGARAGLRPRDAQGHAPELGEAVQALLPTTVGREITSRGSLPDLPATSSLEPDGPVRADRLLAAARRRTTRRRSTARSEVRVDGEEKTRRRRRQRPDLGVRPRACRQIGGGRIHVSTTTTSRPSARAPTPRPWPMCR